MSNTSWRCSISKYLRGICLALLPLLLFSACDSDEGEALKRIQKSGQLRVAIDPSFPPFESVNAQGEIVGLDVDLARAIAQELGVEATFVATGYDALYDALIAGDADIIISALYPDPHQTHAFAFSSAYFNAGEVVVAPNALPIDHIPGDLAGQRISVVHGTAGHMEALQWEKSLAPAPTLLTTATGEEAIEMLINGQAEASVVSNITAQAAIGAHPGLQKVNHHISQEPYVIASRATDTALMEAIEDALDKMRKSGALEKLIQKWMR
ncbi:MAG: substrate-binding periplasmic protein [Anaerolineales bacterium]